MNPININPNDVWREMTRFNEKISAGLKLLGDVQNYDYGTTPKEEIWRDDKIVLYRYRGEKAPTSKTPLLIVYALVNRPYMVDLQEDRSMVRNLLAQGEDVYIIDWGYPDASDRYVNLDDYINRWLYQCVNTICSRHKIKQVNLLGICQGGSLSLCFSSIYPEKVKNLITMVTPVDFHTPDNMLARWTQQMDIDLLVDTLGNVPGDLMNWCYLTLKPFRLNHQKYIGFVDVLDNKKEIENFLRMEKWIFDSPDQAGEAFRQFIKDFYQNNKLMRGGLKIGDKTVNLKNITMPVLNIYAEQDHLVPPSASKPLQNVIGTKDYEEVAFKGGHIGIYVSSRAQREVPPTIHHWLQARAY